MLDAFLSCLSATPPDLVRARELEHGLDWASFTASKNPVQAVFASKGLGWDRGLDQAKCDPPIEPIEGMEEIICEVFGWCVEYGRADLLVNTWVQECGNDHLKKCGFPTEERFPLIEAVHHRFDRAALMCLEVGAHPYRCAGNAIGSEDEDTAFGMATSRKQHSTLNMMAAHQARQSALCAIEEIDARGPRLSTPT